MTLQTSDAPSEAHNKVEQQPESADLPSTEGQQQSVEPPNPSQPVQSTAQAQKSGGSHGMSYLNTFLLQHMPQKLVPHIVSGYTLEQASEDNARDKKELANGKEYLQYF